MKRPVLTFQTIYFHESDRPDAIRLGSDLYDRVTRPKGDLLNPGPGMPVLVGVNSDHVKLEVADTVILIPVLGAQTYALMAAPVLPKLKEWHEKLKLGRVLVVPTTENWRTKLQELPRQQMLAMLYAEGDQ